MPIGQILRRILWILPTLGGVLVVVFVLLRVIPGDPISMMIVGEATPEDIAQIRRLYGLDRSIAAQFVLYLGQIASGDFGSSITMKQPVLPLVLGRLPATLELTCAALLIAVVAGLALGLAAAHWRRSPIEALVDGLSAVLLSIPEFLWGLVGILLLAVAVPLFPISGRSDPVLTLDTVSQFYLVESLLRGRWHDAAVLIEHLALPATALALPFIAVIARVLKTSLIEAMAQDYILLARLKGLSRTAVLLRHALPNAILPVVSVGGAHFVLMIGGTVLVELIFAYPGIGNLLYTAAINRDLPLIQGVAIVFAVLFALINLAVDVLFAALNPRTGSL